MRLEVFCEDRLGLTRELLDLLVLRSIDLRGIEIDPIGRIYLNFAEPGIHRLQQPDGRNPPYFRRNGCPYRSLDAVRT